MTAWEGIYDIDTWTNNATACDAEGDSILDTQGATALYVKVENFLGQKFVNVNTCSDVADCETMASDADTIHVGQWGFSDGSDGDGWSYNWYTAFDNFDDDTKCDGTRHETLFTSPADGAVRLEARTSVEVQFDKPDGVTNCFDLEDEDLEGPVGDPACGRFEVVTATFNEDLP